MVEFRKAWKSATLTSDEVVEVDAQTIVVTGHVTAFDHSGRRIYDARSCGWRASPTAACWRSRPTPRAPKRSTWLQKPAPGPTSWV
jgi:hypothetical protein